MRVLWNLASRSTAGHHIRSVEIESLGGAQARCGDQTEDRVQNDGTEVARLQFRRGPKQSLDLVRREDKGLRTTVAGDEPDFRHLRVRDSSAEMQQKLPHHAQPP